MTVNRKEINSLGMALIWSRTGLVHIATEPVPIGHLSMALILRGCHRGCVEMLHCMMVLWYKILPAAPQLIRPQRTKTNPVCLTKTFNVNDIKRNKLRWTHAGST